jgi:hypothetical protein
LFTTRVHVDAQYFKENPYFSDSVLKKEYKYIPPAIDGDDEPDENGITASMCEFAWDTNVAPQVRFFDQVTRSMLTNEFAVGHKN